MANGEEMKRILYIVLWALLCVGGATTEVWAQTRPRNTKGEELKPVDMKSRRTRPVPVGDSTGYALVGDVVLYHNGSVITCDSMVRYSDKQMTCFGNVIIKKDDTYIYGDRAEYSGEKNEARVFSPLVKVLNKDATLYTYNLIFNTKDNIGEFYGGGCFANGENQMESERGLFYADLDEMVGVDRVELRNETYEMKSDSVNYNSESEVARYFTRSVTWKKDGEILSSDRGEYHNKDEHYIFHSNAYVLGEGREMWADTIDYKAMVQFIELKHNAQIRDEEHQSIIFGDYGNYDDRIGDTFLTMDPAYISYGDSDGDGIGDSVFMRSDSMFLYTIDSLGYCTLTRPDSATLAAMLAAKADSIQQAIRAKFVADSTAVAEAARKEFLIDSLTSARDSVVVAAATDTLARAVADSLLTVLDRMQGIERDSLGQVIEKKVEVVADSLAVRADSLMMGADSLGIRSDSLGIRTDSLNVQSDSIANDSTTHRIMLGLRNVKVFRRDFQGICDSMLMFSVDSTAQLHRNSVMWNELNQITSERADVYTRNQQPHRVFFSEGKPMMVAELDTAHYNQVAGKTIESFFDEEGVMYKTDVVGNAQTYYYMVDDADGAMMGFLVAESADMTFDIEDNTVVGITYRGDPVYTIYPMDQIPADQPQRLPEFVWYIERKPTREAIIGRRSINPSERERYERMRRPQFPITYSIERHKESLVMNGGWADRTDDISEMAYEFIEKVKEE